MLFFRVRIETGDACMLMYANRDPQNNFDVIDLDPYGSASPFIDAAVQSIADGGLLCVTCTDMPVLSGNYPEVCYAKYGSFPVKAKYHHEVALRALLHAIDTSANRYRKHIVPWVSCAIDFYVRVFVRVFVSPAEVRRASLSLSVAFSLFPTPSLSHTHTLSSATCGDVFSRIYSPHCVLLRLKTAAFAGDTFTSRLNALPISCSQWQC